MCRTGTDFTVASAAAQRIWAQHPSQGTGPTPAPGSGFGPRPDRMAALGRTDDVMQLVYALQRLITSPSIRTRVTDICHVNHRSRTFLNYAGRQGSWPVRSGTFVRPKSGRLAPRRQRPPNPEMLAPSVSPRHGQCPALQC